ncbi:MAG: hypothetical protein KGS61_15055, partial [Verrucomicrobia bacterium]|nr:hypothetical protein [Verrucomicrobiota bacterium]
MPPIPRPASVWRRRLVRLGLIVLAPSGLLLAAELCLRLAGYGYPTAFVLRDADHGMYYSNDRFVWQFYSSKTGLSPQPFAVAAQKPPGTIRLVILGESAAVGTPDPSYGFARILERFLHHQYPRTRFEVINAAVRGINSHVIRVIARDCVVLQPDLFIAYMGNNEIVGLYAPGPHAGYLTPYLHVLRAIQWLKTTRVGELMGQWLERLGSGAAPPENQDMAFFRNHRLAADDPRREAVYRNFRSNLDDICQTASRSGAKLILSTLADNLADSPPFGSLHRANLTVTAKTRWEDAYAQGVAAETRGQFTQAIRHYHDAARVDDHFADLHFRLGRCSLAADQFTDAGREYRLARDWDALQFRCDSRLNRIIRETASAYGDAGVRLADAAQALAESPLSTRRIPGQSLFYDHVHLTFQGDYLLARTFYPLVIAALTNRLAERPAAADLPSLAECAASLAFTPLNEAQIRVAMLEAMAQPPFPDQLDHRQRLAADRQALQTRFGKLDQTDVQRAIATYQAAIQQTPDDWQLYYNFARLLFTLRRYDLTIPQF